MSNTSVSIENKRKDEVQDSLSTKLNATSNKKFKLDSRQLSLNNFINSKNNKKSMVSQGNFFKWTNLDVINVLPILLGTFNHQI